MERMFAQRRRLLAVSDGDLYGSDNAELSKRSRMRGAKGAPFRLAFCVLITGTDIETLEIRE
jgi:hypothetical protein